MQEAKGKWGNLTLAPAGIWSKDKLQEDLQGSCKSRGNQQYFYLEL
jgi:hypothetical protein